MPIIVDGESTMLELARSLSFEQRIVFDTMLHYCKSIVMANNGANVVLDPPCFIIHGGGGVGKSYLIKTVSKWIQKMPRCPGDNPDQPKVLKLAPTGKAASLIGGTTLHSALALKFGNDSLPLSDERLTQLRKVLEHLEFVIIDEMSMVSADKLYDIHRRLQQIFVSQDLFGGKTIMLVGDLLQLPPVKGKPIYARPKSFKNICLWRTDSNLWQNCEVVELETNFRQGKGNPWTECLNRTRIAEPSEDDIAI